MLGTNSGMLLVILCSTLLNESQLFYSGGTLIPGAFPVPWGINRREGHLEPATRRSRGTHPGTGRWHPDHQWESADKGGGAGQVRGPPVPHYISYDPGTPASCYRHTNCSFSGGFSVFSQLLLGYFIDWGYFILLRSLPSFLTYSVFLTFRINCSYHLLCSKG